MTIYCPMCLGGGGRGRGAFPPGAPVRARLHAPRRVLRGQWPTRRPPRSTRFAGRTTSPRRTGSFGAAPRGRALGARRGAPYAGDGARRPAPRRARPCRPRLRRAPAREPRGDRARERDRGVRPRDVRRALAGVAGAAHAPEAPLRRAFRRIAADESRHAALSWAVARWVEARLDPAARARRARRRAHPRGPLAAEVRTGPRRSTPRVGKSLPRRARARLVDGLVRHLR